VYTTKRQIERKGKRREEKKRLSIGLSVRASTGWAFPLGNRRKLDYVCRQTSALRVTITIGAIVLNRVMSR
jgi:hypothetical protein